MVGTLGHMTRGTVLVQKLPPEHLWALLVTNAFDFIISSLLSAFVGLQTCRYPRCSRPVFFDRRVDELREWCEQHMMCVVLTIINPCYLTFP